MSPALILRLSMCRLAHNYQSQEARVVTRPSNMMWMNWCAAVKTPVEIII